MNNFSEVYRLNSAGSRAVLVLFGFALTVSLLMPAAVVSGALLHVTVSLALLLGLAESLRLGTKVSNRELFVFAPLFLFMVVVATSNLKGVFIGVSPSLHDFSEYFKFVFPVLVFLVLLSLLRNYGTRWLWVIVSVVLVVYVSVFLIYIYDGGGVIYQVGLGRGDPVFYRYGGLDHNPNAYAGIAGMLSFLALVLAVSKRGVGSLSYWALFFLILASFILAQSRTNIIAFVLVGSMIALFFPISVLKKAILVFMGLSFILAAANYFDLYWLTYPGRFDVIGDRSFGIRVERSVEQFWGLYERIGVLGIGPGKASIDRLDTISYMMYLIRYGWLGVFLFVVLHLWVSFYFFRLWWLARKRGRQRSLKSEPLLVVNTWVPVYILFLNVSNEKWIDIKFMVFWALLMAAGQFYAMRERTPKLAKNKRAICSE